MPGAPLAAGGATAAGGPAVPSGSAVPSGPAAAGGSAVPGGSAAPGFTGTSASAGSAGFGSAAFPGDGSGLTDSAGEQSVVTGPARAENSDEDIPLKGWPWLTGGMLAVVLGALWTAQGLDLAEGSLLTGQTLAAFAGPVVALAGLALIVMGVRIRAAYKAQLTAAPD